MHIKNHQNIRKSNKNQKKSDLSETGQIEDDSMFKIIFCIFKQEETYRICIIFQMEIETPKIVGVFSPVNETQLSEIKYSSVLYRIQVGFQQFKPHTHRLILTRNYIFLTHISNQGKNTQQTDQILATKVDFELKFQIEFSQQNNPKSSKIGLKLFRNSQQSTKLYSSHEHSLQQMRVYLGRYLNQKGFHNQFKPVKKLGKGNFASVYQVIRIDDGKKLAVKAFSKANTYNAENGKESLINELSVMRELSHQSKNLLSLEAVYQSDNSIYVVLELLQGRNLFEVIKEKQGIFTLSQVRSIMKGLLRGLQCMHSKKIMHRDLKPQNIMFRHNVLTSSDSYQPVIVDFGLAAHSEAVPYLFYRCGTPGFVAPEIIKIQKNQYYSPECDMFSIGCIFHLLLTSQPIFPGIKYQQVYKKNKFLEFHIKQDLINKINPFAIDMLERMIEQEPKVRLTPSEALKNCFFIEYKFSQNAPMSLNMNLNNMNIIKISKQQQMTDYAVSPIPMTEG